MNILYYVPPLSNSNSHFHVVAPTPRKSINLGDCFDLPSTVTDEDPSTPPFDGGAAVLYASYWWWPWLRGTKNPLLVPSQNLLLGSAHHNDQSIPKLINLN